MRMQPSPLLAVVVLFALAVPGLVLGDEAAPPSPVSDPIKSWSEPCQPHAAPRPAEAAYPHVTTVPDRRGSGGDLQRLLKSTLGKGPVNVHVES